jgi:flagellar biosynthesis protein FliQ
VSGALLHLAREALLLALMVSAPPLLAAFAAGLLAGLLQAITQVHEAALGAVPRIAAVLAALLLAGPWMAGRVARFAAEALALAAGASP